MQKRCKAYNSFDKQAILPLGDTTLCMVRLWHSKKNIVHYRALDPAWLKHHDNDIPEVMQDKKMILLRLEESKASYIADKKVSATKMIDSFCRRIMAISNIVVLCRYEDQIAEVESRYGDKVQVQRDVVDGITLIKSTQLLSGQAAQ